MGKAVGVRLRLDNGISGFVPTDGLSDKKVDSPEERVKVGQIWDLWFPTSWPVCTQKPYIGFTVGFMTSQVGMTIHGRIVKVDIERLQVDVTCKGSDLRDEGGVWKRQLDTYYDYERELADRHKDENANKNSNRTSQSRFNRECSARPADS